MNDRPVELPGFYVENVDKMLNNMEAQSDPFQTPQTETVFHSRATQMKSRVRKQNRNLWLMIFCFIPTCGFCCGLCAPQND